MSFCKGIKEDVSSVTRSKKLGQIFSTVLLKLCVPYFSQSGHLIQILKKKKIEFRELRDFARI